MDEANEATHGDVSNNLIYEAYGYMISEDYTDQDDIDDEMCKKYIGTEGIMDVP